MATNVVMPQMGESLAEGTVTKWLKQVGDKIERDEPLFEISTDKVDSVIPAPAGGYLTAIKVPRARPYINTVVAVIDAAAPSAGPPLPRRQPPGARPAPEPVKPRTPGLPRDTSPLGLNVKEIVVPASIRTRAPASRPQRRAATARPRAAVSPARSSIRQRAR
jgi:2-oxoglutarate dehydrogenase E2 component (dihydrolipoamide succinyltransferase)